MKDRHYRTRYQVGPHEVWGTSLDSPDRRLHTAHDEPADFGLFLDERWRGETNARTAHFVYWPMLEAPVEDELLVVRVEEAAQALRDGQRVEVGCFGGHGRTGTVVALLDVLLGGVSPEAALARMRTDYCEWSVGSVDLERFLFDASDLLTAGRTAPAEAR
jgi:hypothetical protein